MLEQPLYQLLFDVNRRSIKAERFLFIFREKIERVQLFCKVTEYNEQ